MPIEDIKAMPVGEIADENAILWLWTTNAHLRVAFEVVESWGFEYKTLLTWVKDRIGHRRMAARPDRALLVGYTWQTYFLTWKSHHRARSGAKGAFEEAGGI